MSEVKSVEQLADEIRKDFGEKQTAVKEVAEKALAEAEKTGKLTVETKESADKALLEVNTVKEQLNQIEQKMARKPGADGGEIKSFGAQVIDSDKYKSYIENGATGNLRIELKAVTARLRSLEAEAPGDASLLFDHAHAEPLPSFRSDLDDLRRILGE